MFCTIHQNYELVITSWIVLSNCCLCFFDCMQCRHFNFFVSTFFKAKTTETKKNGNRYDNHVCRAWYMISLSIFHSCKKTSKKQKSKFWIKRRRKRELRQQTEVKIFFPFFLERFPIWTFSLKKEIRKRNQTLIKIVGSILLLYLVSSFIWTSNSFDHIVKISILKS